MSYPQVFVFETKPDDFVCQMEVVGCFIEVDKQLLLVEVGAHKLEAGKWGVPGGKIEKGESPIQAAIRELFEETAIQVDQYTQIDDLGKLFIQKPFIKYSFHLFKFHFSLKPKVILSDENPSYGWFSFEEISNLSLMASAPQAINKYLKETLK